MFQYGIEILNMISLHLIVDVGGVFYVSSRRIWHHAITGHCQTQSGSKISKPSFHLQLVSRKPRLPAP